MGEEGSERGMKMKMTKFDCEGSERGMRVKMTKFDCEEHETVK